MYRPILMLMLGFTLSALSAYGLVHLLGSGLSGVMNETGAKLAAATVMLACVVIDSGLFELRTPMWQRQTPQQHFYRFGPTRGALLWGLDTGLVLTTFRVTSLTWAALGVTLFGLVPWWAGLAYALGFTLPSFAMVALVPQSKDLHETPEPIWLMDWLMERGKPVRRAALGLLTIAFAGVVASVFLS
ncbi:hypothetical protein ACIBF6_43210 [Streptosporangium amethystogenes]|uniref:hypothetical protein n=1 Tax=Streptosporangium amethystogenes TaxID=2002 RepID=UPI0037A82185